MSRELFKHYGVNDFDNFDCLKVSKGLYLILAFVLRAYLVFAISISNMRDKTQILQWFYPDPSLFYLNLLSGLAGLYLLFVLMLRKPDAAPWVRWSWRHCRAIIVAVLAFDLLVSSSAYMFYDYISLKALLIELAIAVVLVVFCFRSKRFKINLTEFPEKLPEK
ncbi:DUF2919 family protein [Thalassotalea agarivorans]|uniref:DUF2919 domain-containing protein n=1 Tax=Thalassotalea agarivorans TaxID=349064 RepID=A0A1I0FKC7_THASX|nr:DUF2919 family protein [Thalassotalea agarivorans]SET57708.1 Protein of unknown function [Thalassotalea agarivorans]